MRNKLKIKRGTLAYTFRHNPKQFNPTPQKGGWFNINDVLREFNITFEDLKYIVENDNKGRFSINFSDNLIRAN